MYYSLCILKLSTVKYLETTFIFSVMLQYFFSIINNFSSSFSLTHSSFSLISKDSISNSSTVDYSDLFFNTSALPKAEIKNDTPCYFVITNALITCSKYNSFLLSHYAHFVKRLSRMFSTLHRMQVSS